MFLATTTHTVSALLMRAQNSNAEEHTRVLVCPVCRSTPRDVAAPFFSLVSELLMEALKGDADASAL